MTDAFARAVGLRSRMIAHRRYLHARPEIGLELPDTGDYVEQMLRDLGLATERHAGAGVTAVVSGTAGAGPTTVLRSDMDALPVEEETGLPFASTRPGRMHACGHDLHMAMLLGAAEALVAHPPERDVVLAFQPGEESDRGAVPMLQSHRSLQTETATAFAIHVHAGWPAHQVHYRRGTFMANGDWFEATFEGPGGHASQPHLAGNPIEAGAGFVSAAGALVRELAAEEDPVVATVTEFRMGNTVNVIPTRGSIRGTLRTLSTGRREAVVRGLEAAVSGSATASRTTGRFTLHEGYPAVVNDSGYVDRMVAALADSPAAEGLTEMGTPSMVIEDFSYFLQRWPGAMVYLGAQVEGRNAFNHAPDADFDEAVLSTGLALHLLAADGFQGRRRD